MPARPIDYYTRTRFDGGISDFSKNAPDIEYRFGRSIDVRSDPHSVTLLPKTAKESGGTITDLIKDGDIVGTDAYLYGDSGNIYKRTFGGSYTLMRSVADSHANGMKYYREDDYLYYTTDTAIGRYGQLVSSEIPGVESTFSDNFLAAEGGIPQNTGSLDLEASSSQYASRADTASLSITGDLAIEAWIKPESLPSTGNSMVLMSKWDENGNIRSYKFEIYAVSGYFGDGSDGALTISSNTTEAPIDSACTGTSGTNSLSATNASFAAGQIVLIHQTRGTGAGTWQKNKISSYTAGTITLETNLSATYSSGAQVRVLPQYTNVTVNSGITWTAKAWNGTVGGILAFLANGTVTVTGTITATGKGFRGGASSAGSIPSYAYCGEGTSGVSAQQSSANGNGGGGGALTAAGKYEGGGGGGGGDASMGVSGTSSVYNSGGTGGQSSGTADLTTLTLGGGGGSGMVISGSGAGGAGGTGGGIIFISTVTYTMTGAVSASGGAGSDGTNYAAGGGGGAGGSILIKAQESTLGSSLINATGGAGGAKGSQPLAVGGGAGSTGRIHLDYYTSYTGTTSPTLDVTQDNTLVTNTTYQLRLALSSNGTAEEFLTKNIDLQTDTWTHVAVSWDASDSEAEFFENGASLGTSSGAVTSLDDNASAPSIGCDFDSSAQNFYDGLIDEVRVWNTERTETQIFNNKEIYISTGAVGLVGWWQLNSDATDSQASGNNDLTESGSPSHSTDVPFSAATTRNDLDQSLDTSGNTYTCPASINEGATHRQTFVPQKDPQKSIEINFGTKGTGTVQVTVHDSLNRIIHQKEVDTTNLPSSGDYEFMFDTVWTPIRGATYHFHITSTTGDATVVTTDASDLETADFHTYYQFLTNSDADGDAHPIEQIVNKLAIGNGRYVATYSASAGYDPHTIVLPSNWRIRCFTLWRGFLVIGCGKGDSITDTDEGMLFFWDGYSTTYTDYKYIPEGAINAMKEYKGKLYIFAGYKGEMIVYEGGDSTNDDQKKRIPKLEEGYYVEIYPKAITVWDGLLRIGAGGSSGSDVLSPSETIEKGVYTFGRKLAKSPTALTYDYPISTGTRQSSNIEVGLVLPVNGKLLVGWKNNVSYGVDVVDNTASPFSTGVIEMPITDYGRTSKKKQVYVVRAEFNPLNSGETIKLKYKLDRADNWTEGDVVSTANETMARLNIDKGEFRELEIACELGTSVSTSPRLLELGCKNDLKLSEETY